MYELVVNEPDFNALLFQFNSEECVFVAVTGKPFVERDFSEYVISDADVENAETFIGVAPGMDYVLFLVNGIIPFYMFRTGIMQAMNAVQSNKGLFSYRPVKPIDAVIARNILELLLKFIAYVSFSAALIWFGFHISFAAIPQLLMYWILLVIFMFACSLVFVVIADFSKEIQKILMVIFLIMYLLSGILYSIHIIPMPYREYLLWNPLIHIFENMRHAVAPTYALVSGISLGYFMEWLIGTLFFGLLLYKRFEKRMVSSK